MSERQTSEEHTNQDASDSEIFAVLRRVKEEDGIPTLVTSQFNDIWEYDYSNEGLHKRLIALHEDGILGHMKASNRHFWWLSSEGTTDDTSVSSLEELVNYDVLPAEEFSEEKAREIAAEKIPGFEKNAWKRMIEMGDVFMRAGVLIFFFSLAMLFLEVNLIPQEIIAAVLFLGMVFVSLSGGYYLVGYGGDKAHDAGYVSDEPFDKKSIPSYIWSQIKGSE